MMSNYYLMSSPLILLICLEISDFVANFEKKLIYIHVIDKNIRINS
jgi:hypothetical protein